MKYSVKDFTLEEKLLLLTGKDSWHTNDLNGKIKSVIVSDGPNGLRKKIKDESAQGGYRTRIATAMPTISVLSNTWNEQLSYLDGKTIADECLEADVDVLLAPGVNIKRDALNGRNFEYFSEDPYLTGKMARAYIEGVQDKGIGTSLKHFCLNNSEHNRLYSSSEIDERTLNEIYLPAFKESLKANPWTVMCSYNKINGVHASQHKKLLKTVLREKLGYDGLIVSDWGAVHNHPEAIKATLDLRMPYSPNAFNDLKNAYEKGELNEEEIDFCVQNVLNLIEKTQSAQKGAPEYTKEQRHQNAVEIAKEGIVLLKNENVLPLQKGQKACVIGQYSEFPTLGGGGSAFVTTDFVQTKLSELIAQKTGEEVDYITATYKNTEAINLQSAYQKIYDADVAILCVGESEKTVSEFYDRPSFKLSAPQENLIINASKYNKNLVVVLYCGGAIDVSGWIDKVKGVIFAGFAGEGVNEALSSILVGETIPSGKLSETFVYNIEDTATGGKLTDGVTDWYKEGVFVGYRAYDMFNIDVAFAFGHGLSYANFEYSNLSIEKTSSTSCVVSFDIKNTSSVDAKEVSQVYVKEVSPCVVRLEKELKAFSKDLIKAGETKRISVQLDENAFSYYSTAFDKWTVNGGRYEIIVGSSSRDIRLVGKVKI